MQEPKNVDDNDARTRRKWAAYLAYPCAFFHGGVTRLPTMFAPLYANTGLGLRTELAVLITVLHAFGRTFGATFLNPTEIKLCTVSVATLSAVVAFAVILTIPLFPNTTCDAKGMHCFEQDDNSVGKILVRVVCVSINIYVCGHHSVVPSRVGDDRGHNGDDGCHGCLTIVGAYVCVWKSIHSNCTCRFSINF